MKLYWSSRSPFVRKVMVAAHELGLAGTIATERVVVAADSVNEAVSECNPLNKIPTLVLDDGTALYDSCVICEHLDSLRPQPRLFPAAGRQRWLALRQQALGDGLMELALTRLRETRRLPDPASERLLAATERKTAATLDRLERDIAELAQTDFGIGHIAVGCALAYLDFRLPDPPWRTGRPGLAAWLDGFSGRPSVRATEHVDAY